MSSHVQADAATALSENRLKIIKLAFGSTEELPKELTEAQPGHSRDAFLASMADTGGSQNAAKFRLGNGLAHAVDDNVDIAQKILQDPKVTSLRDVALNFGFHRVASLVKDDVTEVHTAALAPPQDTDKAASFALGFRRRMFAVEPTAVLQQMIASDDEKENPSEQLPVHPSAEVRTQVARFLAARPYFNIRTTSVLSALHNDPGTTQDMDLPTRSAVTESLKILQTAQALAPAPEVIRPLLEEGLTSAMRVSSIPKKQFIAKMAPHLAASNIRPAEAKRLAGNIHDHAMANRLWADNALLQIHQMAKGTGLKVIDGEASTTDRQQKLSQIASDAAGAPAAVNLDALFGDMNMCECEACLDVTSPTAYYVDLLQYLRNNNLDSDQKWTNTGKEGIAGTALEKLVARRPDLQHLQLTCANANTALPMIDLANEIMEAFVVHMGDYAGSGKVVIETWNIVRETTDELLASPSHTRKKAYCILKDEVYPVASLPYFQPLDASRLYLGYLGTSRFELIDTFRLAQAHLGVRAALVATPEKKARYATLRGQLQDRAAAAEYLGLSPDEYVIIARESLWPREFSEFADDGTLIDEATYLKDIGVRDPFIYWGYKTAALLASDDAVQNTGLLFLKAQFLPRSGLTVAETAELVMTKYVNPMMPTGKDKVLLDSIRFSYRFLQILTVGITDVKQRSQALGSFLFGTQAWVQAILKQQLPPTGNDLVKPTISTATFAQNEANAWVMKWFDCIGKLVVLEAGEGPQLPAQGYLVWQAPVKEQSLASRTITVVAASGSSTPPADDQIKVLGYLNNKGELRNEKNELVGFVWMNGQVYYGGFHPIRETYPKGVIVLFQIPKQDTNPTAQQLKNMPINGSKLVRVNTESYLEYWNLDGPSTRLEWIIPPDTCSIDNTRLIHLNGSQLELGEWDRINRFLRLYKKLQPSTWTITKLDSALTALGKVPEIPPPPSSKPTDPSTQPSADVSFSFSGYKDKGCDCSDSEDGGSDDGCDSSVSPCDPSNFINISPGFLKELMSVLKLAQLTGLELEKLLCLWSDIGTFGDNSLYSRLFLTHDLEAVDTVFLPDDNGNYLSAQPKIGDHIPVIIAALRIKASIFDKVLQRVSLTRDSIITVTSLTKLYRHALLAGILGIRPDALLDALDLFSDPYQNASTSLNLYLLWSRIAAASFTVKQLRYITLNIDDPLRPISPDKVKVLRTTKAIMDGLAAIDVAQPDLTTQEEATITVAQVKAKATLIFDPAVVDDIMGLIQGTKLYTTNAPVGLTVDQTKISPKIIYKDPLTPLNRRATLSVTGCLTDAEMTAALALFVGNSDWSSALQRLKKQAQNLVKSILATAFPDSIDEAVQTLTQGDVPAPLLSSDTTANPSVVGMAVTKSIYFMQKFMPYLRSYLYSDLIVTTMSSLASVSSDIAAWLLNEVITVNGKKAMQVLIDVKGHTSSNAAEPWTGQLLPPTSDTYVFYGYGDTQPPPLIIGGTSYPFATQNEDPSNLWWTTPIALVGGRMTSLQVTGQVIPGDLQWKTDRSAIAAVPTSALVPDASVSDAASVFAPLVKASMVIQGFSLNLTELAYFQTHGANFSGLDFNTIILDAWKRLLNYYELRKSLPQQEKGLIDLFKWASLRDTATPQEITAIVSAVSTWDPPTITVLLGNMHLDFEDVKLFRDEAVMLSLNKIFTFIQKVGILDVNLLLSWTDLKLDFEPTWKLAKSIRQTIRGKYSASDYEQAIKPVHDQLRKDQRDALISFLLVKPAIQKWGVTDADGLFEFFLLDVQMGSCMQTSRTKQAISSVQLFVQRCMLGLEEQYSGLANDALDAQRWQWMSKQTIWTANRKVFLYPENWLVPSLRDDKTPIYTLMESELLQRDVNPSTLLESFRGYVTGLAQIAQLRAIGLHVELADVGKYVLHCVAMTPSSPYMFFHRKYDFFTHEWTPWVRISVDIPTYTVEFSTAPIITIARIAAAASAAVGDKQQVGTATGAYVVPVAWRSRTLLFIGEITKKAKPNPEALGQTFGAWTNPTSTATANSIAPTEVWEIKVSWTEYRNGKWTQKQAAADTFQTGDLPDIDAFQFIPQIVTDTNGSEHVSIEVWHYVGATLNFDGNYEFNGVVLMQGGLASQAQPTGWRQTNFQLTDGRSLSYSISSLQKSADGASLPYLDTTATSVPFISYETDPNGIVTYMDGTTDIFYHPFSSELVGAASTSTDDTGVQTIEDVYQTLRPTVIDAAFGTVAPVTTSDNIFAELSKPYTNYNWELGFHGPMQVADVLLKSQQFDQALTMMHQVFNPYADGQDIRRVWKWYPFQHTSSQRVLATMLDQLKPRTFDLNITKWRDHPFQPYVVARGRTVAYMKWTVMLYIETLIAYGDMYFRRRTLEDVPLAIQLYVLASHLFGAKGETIPKRGKKIPQTYFSLLDKWDAFGNAIVQLELAFPFSNQTPFPWGVDLSTAATTAPPADSKQIALADIFGFATSSYFCLPSNPDLQALRTTIDQRLYNIRNCLDIDGRPMPLALWDPPIDPGELVAAVASGLSLASALNDLNASLPNYRFTWLLTRALEMTAELKSLEGTFLSIKEKRDSEALQLMRSGNEITVHKLVLELKKVQLDEASKTLAALQNSQETPKNRFDFYSKLAGIDAQPLGSTSDPFKPMDIAIDVPSANSESHINMMEIQSETEATMAQFWNNDAATLEIMAGILHALPSFNMHATPMGCGVEVAWGMPNLGAAAQAQARLSQLSASNSTFGSSQASRKANYLKVYQDRVHQTNLAGLEFEHINTQIAAQQIRIQIANMDITNQQQIIDNASEVDEFLRSKYTNDELYSYLESTTRTAMYQTYLLAYDLAKKAELAFRFERRPTAVQQSVNFITFGYFNPAHDGLQASQQLYMALKNMDAAYQDSRGHDYEITKSISLRQLNPYALLQLRETGSCTFDIPEVLFDMDFPGHYFRRIKTASLTIPCVVGPYTGVNATLRLLKHRYRADPNATSSRDYVEDTSSGALDARFRTAIVPIDTVATSSAQNDAGAFELSLKDERYVPFEGAGAVATWELTLPPNDFRPFDYASIADVVLILRYTACEGGHTLRKAATDSVTDWVASVEGQSKEVGLLALWDIRAEFAAEWAKLSGGSTALPGANDIRTLVFKSLNSRLPSFVAGRDPSTVRAKDVSLVTTLPFTQASDLVLDLKYVLGGSGDADTAFDSGPLKVGSLNMFRISDADDAIGDWALKVKLKPGMQVDSSSRMWVIVRYTLAKKS